MYQALKLDETSRTAAGTAIVAQRASASPTAYPNNVPINQQQKETRMTKMHAMLYYLLPGRAQGNPTVHLLGCIHACLSAYLLPPSAHRLQFTSDQWPPRTS
jgi:hypothetical protein